METKDGCIPLGTFKMRKDGSAFSPTTSQCPHRPPRAMWLVNQKIKSAILISEWSPLPAIKEKSVRGFVLWGHDHWPGRGTSDTGVAYLIHLIYGDQRRELPIEGACADRVRVLRFGTLWYVHDAHEVCLSIAPVVVPRDPPGLRFSRPRPHVLSPLIE